MLIIPLSSLRGLFAHMEWADARVWHSVLAAPAAANDPKLREWLHHIHMVQRAFLSVWRGEAPELTPADRFPTLADIAAWGRSYYPQAHAYLDAVSETALASEVTMPWAALIEKMLGRPPAATSLADTLFQVTHHSHYHRAQVNARLRELGGDPPLVDYIAWVWMDRPAPEWSLT